MAQADIRKPVQRERLKVGQKPGKLYVKGEIPGWHLRIVNDVPGRIPELEQRGYQFVTVSDVKEHDLIVPTNGDLGDKIRFHAGTAEFGGPLYAYLMKIPQEFYDEDQKVYQSELDVVDTYIETGKDPLSGSSREQGYVPKHGIKVSR